jgi:hypothetical protein
VSCQPRVSDVCSTPNTRIDKILVCSGCKMRSHEHIEKHFTAFCYVVLFNNREVFHTCCLCVKVQLWLDRATAMRLPLLCCYITICVLSVKTTYQFRHRICTPCCVHVRSYLVSHAFRASAQRPMRPHSNTFGCKMRSQHR